MPRSSKRSRTGQDDASTSTALPPVNAPSVWPKREGEPISIDRVWEKSPKETLESRAFKNRPIENVWDEFDSLYYNEWLGVKLAQTRVADPGTMRKLKIERPVLRILEQAGLGTLATMHYSLYPDLVRQFMATVQCYFQEGVPDAQNGVLTFLLEGTRHRIPFRDLCDLYGFDPEPRGLSFPSSVAELAPFWRLFGNDDYSSSRSVHTDIRHPVLRYAVRLFANTIYCKVEPGKMRSHELVLLYAALQDVVGISPHYDFRVNIGAVFAQHLVSLKTTPFSLKKSPKELTVGSLLTPIFESCGVDLSTYQSISQYCTADIDHLQKTQWIVERKYWIFRDELKVSHAIQLPRPEWMDIFAQPRVMKFDVAPSDYATHIEVEPRPPPRASRAASRAAPRTSTDGAGTSRQSTRYPRHHFTFPSYPQEPMTDAEHRTWVGRGLKAIWDAVAGISECVRPRTPSPQPSPPVSPREEDA